MALEREEIMERLASGDGAADLSGLDLSGADLSRLDLRGVNLSRADLSSADLRWSLLEGADLHSTVLRRADARWAIFRGANLRQADLSRANMGWADITGADLTGADLDGTNLDNVVLSESIVERRVPSRDWILGRVPGGEAMSQLGSLSLSRLSPTAMALVAIGLVCLVGLWGWLYQRTYFGAFGVASQPGLLKLASLDNLWIGLVRVLGLTLAVLLVSPLLVIAALVILGLLAAIALGLVRFSERLLGDIGRPQVRALVMLALFVFYTALFFVLSPFVLDRARRVAHSAAPKGRGLASVFGLVEAGGWLARLGLLAVAAAAAIVVWVAFRWFAHWLRGYELPTRWRLRYPALESGLAGVRSSRLMRRHEPLTAEERRRGALAFVAGGLLLATALSGVGRVHALYDMCDGGRLARVQLYVNRMPAAEPDSSTVCQRLLAKTDDAYLVFFPSQTTQSGALHTREANVSTVAADQVEQAFVYTTGQADCATCQEGPTGTERDVMDPDEIEVSGMITERTADLLLLNVPQGTIGGVRVLPTTTFVNASGRREADGASLQSGVTIRAIGHRSADGMVLEARQVVILPSEALPPPAITVDLSGAPVVTISGSGWRAGSQVYIGISPTGVTAPQQQLSPQPINVLPDGTFSVPIDIPPDLPTGADWQVVVRDPESAQYATGAWLQQPLPTATPTPTRYVPTSPPETTPMPGQTPPPGATSPSGATETPGAEATNTPLARPSGLAPGTGIGCQPDEYEQDWPRGYEKEIFVSFSSEGTGQKHNFCPRGDIDLAWFRVKKDRWYRVSTQNLAQGVDTVMAVGDLSNATYCSPPGCWNDDRAALTYESEVVFQAVEDDRAMITVDNWGSYSEDATYELSVVEFEPTPTTTPTVGPSATPTATPTTTKTPLPFVDRCEPNDTCRVSGDKCRLIENAEPILATIYPGTDEDYYETYVPLGAGATYTLTLLPPVGQDYDLELLVSVDKSRNVCPLAPVKQGYNSGDVPEVIVWKQGTTQTMVARVYTAYPTVYGTAHQPYRLWLQTDGKYDATVTATSTETPTATRTHTPTVTVTASATETPSLTPTLTASVPVSVTVTPTGTSLARLEAETTSAAGRRYDEARGLPARLVARHGAPPARASAALAERLAPEPRAAPAPERPSVSYPLR